MAHQNNNYNNYNNFNNNFNNNYNRQFNSQDELYATQQKTLDELEKNETKLKSDIKFGVSIIVVVGIIVLILIGVFIFGKGKEEPNNNTVDVVETEKTIGNDKVGYVVVPIDWVQYSPIDSSAFMYSDPTQTYVIALEVTDKTDKSIEEIANTSAKNMMNNGFKEVSVNKVLLGEMEAYKIDAFAVADNKWAINWVFIDSESKVRIISFETPNTDNDFMTIAQTFKYVQDKDTNKKDTK